MGVPNLEYTFVSSVHRDSYVLAILLVLRGICVVNKLFFTVWQATTMTLMSTALGHLWHPTKSITPYGQLVYWSIALFLFGVVIEIGFISIPRNLSEFTKSTLGTILGSLVTLFLMG